METSSEIVKKSGSNLAFALALLPPGKRSDMETFYAFCRVIDDIADDPRLSRTDKQLQLDDWKNIISGKKTPQRIGMPLELLDLIEKYHLDLGLLGLIIEGVELDLNPDLRFETAQKLREYCYRVASAVGLVSIEIFGYENEQTKTYAEQLGYALQWTNIMRDVGEDAAEGRIYLPLEDLDRFHVKQEDLLHRAPPGEAFFQLMDLQRKQAERFFTEAEANLPDCDRPSMSSAELMRRIYSALLAKMARDNYCVFEKRYRLSKGKMLAEFLRAKYETVRSKQTETSD